MDEVSSRVWYSAAVRLVVDIAGQGVVHDSRSVFVFRAVDFDEAFTRAVALGRGLETSYLNGDGEEVRWLLDVVETLDELGDDITDGREVYSEQIEPRNSHLPLLAPELSKPTQSGV